MTKRRLYHRTWLVVAVVAVATSSAGIMTLGTGRAAATATIWFQQQDSCRQAVAGGSFALQGNGVNQRATPGGTGTKSVGAGSRCPAPRGNCLRTNVGCIEFLSIPAPGTYTIKMSKTPPGNRANPGGYAACNGGSGCRSEAVTVTVAANGSIQQVTTTNVYPNGSIRTWHNQGTQQDPVVYHAFGLGSGSCDGDRDFDDHLTGSPSSKCGYTPESSEATATRCPTYPWECTLVRP